MFLTLNHICPNAVYLSLNCKLFSDKAQGPTYVFGALIPTIIIIIIIIIIVRTNSELVAHYMEWLKPKKPMNNEFIENGLENWAVVDQINFGINQTIRV